MAEIRELIISGQAECVPLKQPIRYVHRIGIAFVLFVEASNFT